MFEIKEAGRQVFFDVELGVNYVTHLYTLAKAGFDDPAYVKQYASSLMPTSLEYLRANAELYSFYGRDQGPFADLLYFTPSYFNFETTEEFSDYFAAWDEAIKRKSHRPFEQYTLHSQHMIRFFSADDQTWKQEILPLDRVFAKIGRIYVDNFDTYKKEIWPNIHPVLIRCSQVLNQMMEPNLIEHWEECTGLQFEKEHYKIILYFAGQHGPSWNNLSLGKNSAFYNQDKEDMVAMASHEIGIHILLPHLQETIQDYERTIQDYRIQTYMVSSVTWPLNHWRHSITTCYQVIS